jgi:hypothetical protein
MSAALVSRILQCPLRINRWPSARRADHDLSNIFNLRQETNFARTVFFAFGFRRRGKDLTRFEKCQGKKWSLSDGWGKQEER